ncbi:MAG: hypothetical protein ABSB28_06690 [Candidatus Bathyarchaeia archaeon]
MKEHKKKRVQITGPGIVKAVQEATDTGKDLVTVRKYDEKTGKIIEIGYFLAEKGKPVDSDWRTKIKWLRRNEVNVIYDTCDQENDVETELGVTYSPPERLEEKGREFLLTLDLPGSKIMRFRNIFQTDQSRVSSFVVQFEIYGFKREPEQWKAIARYDCAHGYIHRDLIYSDGRKEKKKTRSQDLGEAIKIATSDLKDNSGNGFRSLDMWKFLPCSLLRWI